MQHKKKGVVARQAAEDAVVAKDVVQKHVLALTAELSGVMTAHAQESHAREAEVEALKVQLIIAEKRADDAEWERS